jgi:hypothetical protein
MVCRPERVVSGYSGAHGFARVASRVVRRDGGEEVAHHRDVARPDGEHVVVRRLIRHEDRHVVSVRPVLGVRLTDGVVRLLAFQDGQSQPDVRGHHQVPPRLGEGPLPVHRDVDRAGRHRRDPVERGCPGLFEPRPSRAQAPCTSTPRITAPERSALTNRAPRRFASTNSAPFRSSDRVKVVVIPSPSCVLLPQADKPVAGGGRCHRPDRLPQRSSRARGNRQARAVGRPWARLCGSVPTKPC